MARTKVKVEIFKKGSGKYYTEHIYNTDKHVIDQQGILEEVIEKYSPGDKPFTIEVSSIGDIVWNKWLILGY